MELQGVVDEIRRREEEKGGKWHEEMKPWLDYYRWLDTEAARR